MSTLILIILPIGLAVELYYLTTTPDWASLYSYLFASSLFLIVYALNRTPWVTAASYLNIAISIVMTTWMAASDPLKNYDLLFYLLYPIIVGVYFFCYPQCIFISITALAIVVLYAVAFPVAPRNEIFNGPFSVLLVFSVIMHILKSYRGTVEADRQRDLAEHEERYRALLETTYEGICSLVNGKIIETNPGFERLFGYDTGEMPGMDVLSLFAESDRGALNQKKQRVLEGNREVHMLKRNGEVFPAEAASHLQRIKKQTIEVLAIRDISVRKWSEEALQQAYDEMEHMINERTAELTMANTRLQREVDERKEAENLQRALHRISEAAYATPTPQALFPVIHEIIAGLIPALNLFIALYDAACDEVSFPYFVDEFDPPPASHPLGQGPTDWVIRNGEPFLLLPDNLKRHAGILAFSAGAESDNWLGVPLKRKDGRTIGALVVQNYASSESLGMRYTEKDKTLLNFVSSQVAMSIERKQVEYDLSKAQQDLEQRVAERTAGLLQANEALRAQIADLQNRQAPLQENPQRPMPGDE